MIQLIDGKTPTSHLSEMSAQKYIKGNQEILIKNCIRANNSCIDLVEKCLIQNPDQRITSEEILLVNSIN